jgi:hypothetical protein
MHTTAAAAGGDDQLAVSKQVSLTSAAAAATLTSKELEKQLQELLDMVVRHQGGCKTVLTHVGQG